MSSVYDRCDELRERILSVCPLGTDPGSFLKEVCRPDFPETEEGKRGAEFYTWIFQLAKYSEPTMDILLDCHRKLFAGHPGAGILRTKRLYLGDIKHMIPAPEALPALVNGYLHRYRELDKDEHPVRLAAQANQKFAFLYPFTIGTLEMGQLIMNAILVSHFYPPLSLPQDMYSSYKAALEKACENLEIFNQYIAERVCDTQHEILEKFEAKLCPVSEEDGVSVFAAKSGRVFFVEQTEEKQSPVYALIAAHPGISKSDICKLLSLSSSLVSRELAALKKSKIVEFRGLPQSGGYFFCKGRKKS